MRVTLFANRLVDPLRSMTGIGRYIRHLVPALAGLGDGVSYRASAPAEGAEPRWLPPDVEYVPVPGSRPARNGLWALLGRPPLERLIGATDVVHLLHPSFPVPTGRPALLTVHDLMPITHPQWSGRVERWAFRRSLERAVGDGATLVTVSHFVAEQLAELELGGPESVVCVHHGVDRAFADAVPVSESERVRSRYGLPPGDYLLTLGRISPRKNLPVLLRAVAALGPDAPALVLAGPVGSDAGPLAADIDRLRLQGRVRVTGFVADVDLPALVQGARALLHPSLDEGFGLPALEGMAAGAPVVASRAGSLPEIVGDAGLLVDPSDSDRWAEAIHRTVTDGELAADLARRGRSRAAAFTWRRAAELTAAAHRRALVAT